MTRNGSFLYCYANITSLDKERLLIHYIWYISWHYTNKDLLACIMDYLFDIIIYSIQ